jgi:hypothetical protein
MRYTLLGKDLWKYVADGINPLNLLGFGVTKPNFHQKSTEEVKDTAHEFMVNDARANSYTFAGDCHHSYSQTYL